LPAARATAATAPLSLTTPNSVTGLDVWLIPSSEDGFTPEDFTDRPTDVVVSREVVKGRGLCGVLKGSDDDVLGGLLIVE